MNTDALVDPGSYTCAESPRCTLQARGWTVVEAIVIGGVSRTAIWTCGGHTQEES